MLEHKAEVNKCNIKNNPKIKKKYQTKDSPT